MCDKSYDAITAKYFYGMVRAASQSTEGELEFIEHVFSSVAQRKVKAVLDVGCGAGRHTIPLAIRGYQLTGIDASPNMLSVLSSKAVSEGVSIQTHRLDMRNIDFVNVFDAIICMNSVLGYLHNDGDILQTLARFFKALKSGGALIIDVMNYLSLFERFKEVITGEFTSGDVFVKWIFSHRIDEVHAIWYHDQFLVVNDAGKLYTSHEVHALRMLNFNELRRMLDETGFQNIQCFGDFADRKPAEEKARRLIVVALRV
ncbi:class I SAM-dependent methyltransferase [Candidatus Poribacteria bacterium]|nr:class I SAM-dependent methyltransferase [Candidatus Poribacteria bacterium]